MAEKQKSLLVILVAIIIFFIIPYLWRQYRDRDINENGKYTFGKVIKRTGSLKNGTHWHYEFYFNNQLFDGYRSTHVEYKVDIGDYFIINFSVKNLKHNKIIYEYKLKNYNSNIVKRVWDKVPFNLIESTKK